MAMRLLTSAVFAGLAAGLIAALLQFSFVTSSLLEGELYESGAKIHFPANGSPQSPRGGAEVDFGEEPMRYVLTAAFNVVSYTGFALVMVALMALAETRGLTRITPRQGLVWGVAGFVAVQLAPAIGQPPVLPGSIGAEVGPRQAWWLATIVSAGLAMWLLAFGRGLWPFLAVPLLLAPQIVGAPVLDTYFGVTPAELAASFAAMSLGYAAAGWTALGVCLAYFYSRARDA